MDTGKLLKVIEDIQQDESKFNLQTRFQNILNAYNQNTPEVLNTEKDLLERDLPQTRLSNYVLTDFQILEGLEMETFFGERSWVELNNILNNQAHEVAKKLTDFSTKRQESLTKLNTIKTSLNAVGVLARELSEKEYEIGFSFPAEYQKLQEFEKVVGDIQLFLTAIATATSEKKEFKINYVSNGTIEIFIQASSQLAHYFGLSLEYALKIYETILMANALKKGYEYFTKDRRESLDKMTDAQTEESSNTFIDELVIELKIEKPEDKTSVSLLFKRMLKHFENGVSAEVKTPILEKPPEPQETDNEETKNKIKELKKQYESKNIIDLRNKKIFKLQQNKFFGLNTGFLSDRTENT